MSPGRWGQAIAEGEGGGRGQKESLRTEKRPQISGPSHFLPEENSSEVGRGWPGRPGLARAPNNPPLSTGLFGVTHVEDAPPPPQTVTTYVPPEVPNGAPPPP